MPEPILASGTAVGFVDARVNGTVVSAVVGPVPAGADRVGIPAPAGVALGDVDDAAPAGVEEAAALAAGLVVLVAAARSAAR